MSGMSLEFHAQAIVDWFDDPEHSERDLYCPDVLPMLVEHLRRVANDASEASALEVERLRAVNNKNVERAFAAERLLWATQETLNVNRLRAENERLRVDLEIAREALNAILSLSEALEEKP